MIYNDLFQKSIIAEMKENTKQQDSLVIENLPTDIKSLLKNRGLLFENTQSFEQITVDDLENRNDLSKFFHNYQALFSDDIQAIVLQGVSLKDLILNVLKHMQENPKKVAGVILKTDNFRMNLCHPVSLALLLKIIGSYPKAKIATAKLFFYQLKEDLPEFSLEALSTASKKSLANMRTVYTKILQNPINDFFYKSENPELEQLFIPNNVKIGSQWYYVSNNKQAFNAKIIIPVDFISKGLMLPYYGLVDIHKHTTSPNILNGTQLSVYNSLNISSTGTVCLGNGKPSEYTDICNLQEFNADSAYSGITILVDTKQFMVTCIETSKSLMLEYLKGLTNAN